MKREIILGYDPDHGGADVLSFGRILAEVLAAKPVVVTALPWPTLLVGVEGVEDKLAEQMTGQFASIHAELDDLGVETRAIASGTPAAALSEVAEAESAQLIVIGSCHRGPAGRTLAGSVGESLLHGATRSVAIVPRGYSERDQQHLRRVGIAFDGSPEAWTALETAIGIVERCHAKLSVLTVADYPRYTAAAAWTLLAVGELQDAEQKDKERLRDLAMSRIPEALETDSRVLSGEPARELAHVSGEFDLMLTGSRSWGPLKRTMLGSTTRALIRHAECPVLILPRGVGVDPLGVRDPRRAPGSVPQPTA